MRAQQVEPMEAAAGASASSPPPGPPILLRIAEQVNMAPCMLARSILRLAFKEQHRTAAAALPTARAPAR